MSEMPALMTGTPALFYRKACTNLSERVHYPNGILNVSTATQESGVEKSVSALTDALSFAPKDSDSFLSAYGFVLNQPLCRA